MNLKKKNVCPMNHVERELLGTHKDTLKWSLSFKGLVAL